MPNPLILIFLIGFALFALMGAGLIYWFRVKRQQVDLTAHYEDEIEDVSRVRVDEFYDTAEIKSQTPDYSAQSYEWQYEMKKVGDKLKEKNIKNIIFIHGTFAGEDPFGIFHMLSELVNINEEFKQKIKDGLFKSKNSLFKDLGNFSDEYIKLSQDALGINCHHFGWSSENHHLARVEAAVELVSTLVSYETKSPMLLIGHSHAGAAFALITQFMNNKDFANNILSICDYGQGDIKEFKKQLGVLKQREIHIVTFGSPIRYPWHDFKNIKVLHIINHRGNSMLGGSAGGSITTRDGDYIQQWGINGSDGLALTKEKREINLKLDPILGIGNNIPLWLDNVGKLKRVPPKNDVVLIDYKDNSSLPNIHQSLFGHGTYTKYEKMLFNFQVIEKYMYPNNLG